MLGMGQYGATLWHLHRGCRAVWCCGNQQPRLLAGVRPPWQGVSTALCGIFILAERLCAADAATDGLLQLSGECQAAMAPPMLCSIASQHGRALTYALLGTQGVGCQRWWLTSQEPRVAQHALLWASVGLCAGVWAPV